MLALVIVLFGSDEDEEGTVKRKRLARESKMRLGMGRCSSNEWKEWIRRLPRLFQRLRLGKTLVRRAQLLLSHPRAFHRTGIPPHRSVAVMRRPVSPTPWSSALGPPTIVPRHTTVLPLAERWRFPSKPTYVVAELS